MKIKSVIAGLTAAICMFAGMNVNAAEQAELSVYSETSRAAVTGVLDKSCAGDDVSVLLIKDGANPEALEDGDIAYIEDTAVAADGSYSFKFKLNTNDISGHKLYISHEGNNVTSTVNQATATADFTQAVLDISPKMSTVSANVKIDNLFGLDNLTYTLVIASYDLDGNLIDVQKTDDNKIDKDSTSDSIDNIAIPENAAKIKAFCWSSTVGMIPLCDSRDYAKGAIENYDITFPTFTKKAVTFSFDDGREGWDNCVVEAMNRHGIKGTFNLIPGGVNKDSLPDNFTNLYAGHEVANHTSHIAMYNTDSSKGTVYTLDECKTSILQGHNTIKKYFGEYPKGLIWPYHAPAERSDYADIMAYVKELGYSYARNSSSSNSFDMPDKDDPDGWLYWKMTGHFDALGLNSAASAEESPLYKKFLAEDASREFKMLSIWGHAHDFPDNPQGTGTSGTTLVQFEEFLKVLEANKDIWKATNIEIYDYEQAAENVEVGEDYIYNPSKIVTLYGFVNGEKCIIKPESVAVPYEE